MRADRQIALLMLLLERGRMTARDLAGDLEVSERTIHRDIAALSSSGVPVRAERGPHGGCMLVDGHRARLSGLTADEIRALLESPLLRPLDELGYGAALAGNLGKAPSSIGRPRKAGDELVGRLHLDATSWNGADEPAPFLPTLLDALTFERKLRLIYRRGNGISGEWIVDPLGVVAKMSTWYLVGIVPGDIRVFRVSRIRDAEVLEVPATGKAGFDLARFWREWTARFKHRVEPIVVTLRVSPEALSALPALLAEVARSRLEQAGEPDEHGWRVVTLPFTSSDVARASLLALGPRAEVLQPEALRDSLLEWATQTLAAYARTSAAEARRAVDRAHPLDISDSIRLQ